MTITQISSDGYIKLPYEMIKDNIGQNFILFKEEDLIILKKIQSPRITDDLSNNDEVNMEDINLEIKRYREEK